jgi:uncharacterized OB-fold protein
MSEEGSLRPLPRLSPDNRPFWEACRDRELRLPVCQDCGKPHLPPGPVCPFCWSQALDWRLASGRGTIASWVVVHRNWFPAFAQKVPYNVALVELEEGPRLTSTLIDEGPIALGQSVQVAFEDVSEQVTLPVFRRIALG